ncbi:MAG: hypothetical protein GXP63_04540 [DPANN group archaeon]|nr:hypothetical protein [DPANN group archaeon]
MVEIILYPRYISFKQTREGPIILIYGKNKEGRVICAVDRSFRPFCYVLPKGDMGKAAQYLGEVTLTEHERTNRVVTVQEVEKSFFGKPMRLLKVIFEDPWGTYAMARHLQNIPLVENVFEGDINFEQHYALTHRLRPYSPLLIKGEYINFRSRVSVIQAKTVRTYEADEQEQLEIAYLIIEPVAGSVPGAQDNGPSGIRRAWLRRSKDRVLISTEAETGSYTEQILCDDQAMVVDRIKETITSWKPDLLVGWRTDFEGFPLLESIAQETGQTIDMGLDHSPLRLGKYRELSADITGIPHVDLMNVMNKVFREPSFSLKELYAMTLGDKQTPEPIDQLATLTPLILPILRQLSKITGLFIHELTRVPRSRFLDHHIMRETDPAWIVPTRQASQTIAGIEDRPLYELNKSCLKQTVYLTDLAPLIRRIMDEHNISKETLWCSCCRDSATKIDVPSIPYPIWFCRQKKGIMPRIYGDLIQRMERIRSIKTEEKELTKLEARFKALNLLTDRFLTYLSAKKKRYASLVCAEVLKDIIRRELRRMSGGALQSGIELIMADQQHLFFSDQEPERSREETEETINRLLGHRLDLHLTGPYDRVIFIATEDYRGRKRRKYAFLKDGRLVAKRFGLPNTLFANYSDRVIKDIVERAVRGESPNAIRIALLKHLEDLTDGRIPEEDLVFHARLQKELDQYESTPPHVAAALRMKQQGHAVKKGMEIRFFISPGKDRISSRVRLPREKYDIDLQYYLYNQILPQLDDVLTLLGIDIEEIFNADQERLSFFLQKKRQRKTERA